MRFNSPDHVQHWAKTNRYPAIHDDIFFAINSWSNGTRALDLCCSTGLLGQRIRSLYDYVLGVDTDATAIKTGLSAGITIPMVEMKIDKANLLSLVKMMREHGIDTLVARRCMPELFSHDLMMGREFAALIADNGVNEVFLEGRAATKSATNPLSLLTSEVELFAPHYRLAKQHKNVAYLKINA